MLAYRKGTSVATEAYRLRRFTLTTSFRSYFTMIIYLYIISSSSKLHTDLTKIRKMLQTK